MLEAITVNFLSAICILVIALVWNSRTSSKQFIAETFFSIMLIFGIILLQSNPVYFQKDVYFKPEIRIDSGNKVLLVKNGRVAESEDKDVIASTNLLIKAKRGYNLFGHVGEKAYWIYVPPAPPITE